MTANRVETIGDATLYLGDCLDLVDGFDRAWSVVSDPPYGMAWDTDTTRFSGGERGHRTQPGQGRADRGPVVGDDGPFDPAPWLAFKQCVLWGANHFSARLPVGRTLLWMKQPPSGYGTFLSDAEVGWCKGGHGVWAHEHLRGGCKELLSREHPTQKPVSLMTWCIKRWTQAGATILDPYMGAGSTGVAAAFAGRPFVGCELSERYFDAACRRLEALQRLPAAAAA